MNKKEITPLNQKLSDFIRTRRQSLGWNYQDCARHSGLHHSYWNKLENGHYRQPTQKYLRIIATTLNIPVEDLFLLAGYELAAPLPSFTPYLRAKYSLPPEAVADLERYFELLRNYYDIPQDQPVFPPKPATTSDPSTAASVPGHPRRSA